MTKKSTPLLNKMNTTKTNVKITLCENAGKNKTLEENFAKNTEEIDFEFTSSGTPQKNSVVKRVFATIYSQMRAMMVRASLHQNLKNGLCLKWAATTTKLENIMVNPHREKCAHDKLYRKIPDYTKYLRTFGEMIVVRSIATVKVKLEDRLKTCIFLGYSQNNTADI